jgi:integrase/recombinase XerD
MLSEAARDYITLRRASGFKCVDVEELLRSYIHYASERGSDKYLCAATAVEWARLGTSAQRRHRRLRTIGIFAEYLRIEDPRHEAMPRHIFPVVRARRYPPRVFSHEEIARVLTLAGTLKPAQSIRPLTYQTLFGLLFATGMRISEALRLRFNDVQCDGLMIHETKFAKSRQLPLHPSTATALEEYLHRRRSLATDNDYLFLSWRRRRPLDAAHVLRTFQSLCATAGIAGAGGRRKPRLHDLRHSFAVHALVRCRAERDGVNQHMLALSTYLGHSSVNSTYWYLEQTPELLRGIALACEQAQPGAGS